jgi:elongator complex protein 2
MWSAGAASQHQRALVRMNVSPAFISIGGNRNPAAADWDEGGLQLLAFGADNSVALWDPQASQAKS